MTNNLDLLKFKQSSAGTRVDSYELIHIDYEYSMMSHCFITLFGTTRMPRVIRFTCLKTKECFEILTDKNLIEHYMYFKRH